MSRILKKIKNYKKKIAVLVALAILFGISVFTGEHIFAIFLLMLLVGIAVNTITVRKMSKQAEVFGAGSKVRNLDVLIIGELCDIDSIGISSERYLKLVAPDRSLTASYEILRHVCGILKENNSQVILVVKKGNEKGYSIFDIPFLGLSPVSIRRLGLQRLQKKSRFPLLFAPLCTCRFLLSFGNHRHCEDSDAPKEMLEFCRERNITLSVKTIVKYEKSRRINDASI